MSVIALRRGGRDVSLSEIVAVVGVVLLVTTIVLPVFLNARERDREATCISNMGQIGVAFMQYAQDYDGTLFNPYYFEYYKGDRDCGYTADSTLEPYIKNHAAHDANSVWVCPDVNKFAAPNPRSKIGYGAFYCTYTMNVFLSAPQPKKLPGAKAAIPEPDVCYADPTEQIDYKRSWRSGLREAQMVRSEPTHAIGQRKVTLLSGVAATVPILRPSRIGVRLGQIASPNKTDLLFEGIVEDYLKENVDTGYVGRAPRQGDYTLDQGFYPAEWMALNKWDFPLQAVTHARHVRLNNYLFCDGHVKALAPKRYPYDIQHDPDNIWFARIGRDGRPIPPPGGPGC